MRQSPIMIVPTILTLLSAIVQCSLATPTLPQMLGFLRQYNKDWSFPRVTEIAKGINYSALHPDVVGRVDITNTFIGAELNTEYLFGMFSSFGESTTTSLIGVPLNQTISELIVQGNTLSTSLIVTFNWTVAIIPVQFNVFFMFDDDGKITQYDAQLVRSSWIFPTILPQLVPRIAAELGKPLDTDPVTLLTTRAALDICSTHEKFCLGKNRQYNSTAECMKFIQTSVPFGDIWQAGQNTGICRYLHKAMVPSRPQVHCPHIGPSGGDMCIAREYTEEVTANPFSRPFVQLPGGLTIDDVKKYGLL
ncbi:hypothetical protein BD779DRAFT_1632312 [Infundibulicybe gibba]|nr:hypothetical protein BD779DRAFT_1632312 [Infundibulicybe gibba]